MLRTTSSRLGPFQVPHVTPKSFPRPAAPRWQLRLAKARLWDEQIDPTRKAAWQLEDERHMSPEYNEFLGHATRKMIPGQEGITNPQAQFEKLLPNQSVYELQTRRDVPFQDNAMFGKKLHDETTYGMSVPYTYKLFKDMQKANRNDRKIKQNKFKIWLGQGAKNPPSGYTPIPDATEDES